MFNDFGDLYVRKLMQARQRLADEIKDIDGRLAGHGIYVDNHGGPTFVPDCFTGELGEGRCTKSKPCGRGPNKASVKNCAFDRPFSKPLIPLPPEMINEENAKAALSIAKEARELAAEALEIAKRCSTEAGAQAALGALFADGDDM